MSKQLIIQVRQQTITVFQQNESNFISLTDIANGFPEGSGLIGKWITSKNTLEYLAIWERINNREFNYPEFEVIEKEAGSNRFIMSAGQWINRTGAKGIVVKAGRFGGTFADKDIAFHFAMWLSPEFQIYLVKEFQRLKDDEQGRQKLEWNYQRYLTKVNYHIHTDAIKENLIPAELTKSQIGLVYASEADLLNVVLFGKTAGEWRDENPDAEGNIRDAATIEQLVVLSNMESLNAVLIHQGLHQEERMLQLHQIAKTQMKSLLQSKSLKKLEKS
jgi:hypothetical protein